MSEKQQENTTAPAAQPAGAAPTAGATRAAEGPAAAEAVATGQGAERESAAGGRPRRGHRRRNIVIALCVVVVLLGAGIFAGFATGVFSPANAAAKYDLFDYIYEDEVTDYIETYKTQMGYGGNATDEQWATFLASYNMTPERLRASTIDQLLTNKLIEQKCAQLGITVSDAELDNEVQSYKNTYASGSDDIWTQTLGQFGQTEEGFRESRRLELMKEKLCENQVPTPQVSDDQVRQTVGNFVQSAVSNDRSLTLKHSYCFRKSKSGTEGSLEEREQVEKVRGELLKAGASEESFASVVQLYSDDDALRQSSGANGWDADTSGYSDAYVKALGTVGKGGVSSVFEDDDGYFFIWVSQTYTLPKSSAKAEKLDLDKMPEALHRYFSDTAAYSLWQKDAQTYLANLTTGMNVVYFPMPADVPYNVDMSLAQTGDGAAAGANSSSSASSAASK